MEKTNINTPMTKRELFSVGLGGFSPLVTAYSSIMLYFYTDVVKLSAVVISTLFFLSRIWDAINDPIMGIIVDRTHSRWGKLKPYFIFGAIPIHFILILLFTSWDLNGTAKVIYAAVFYVLANMAITAFQIPNNSKVAVTTINDKERVRLGQVGGIASVLSGIMGGTLIVSIADRAGKGDAPRGWTIAAIIFGIIGMVFMLNGGLHMKERVQRQESRESLKIRTILKLVFTNRNLVAVVLSCLAYGIIAAMNISGNIYFFQYVLNAKGLFAISGLLSLVFILLGLIFLVPVLVSRLGKRRSFYCTNIFGILCYLMAFFFGKASTVWLVVAMLALTGMIMSFCNILQQLILADVADQIQIESGQRVEGTLAASTGFAQKLGGALGGMLGALYLSFIGYVPDAVQTPAASVGIRMLATIVPAVAMAITAFLYFKVYTITQEREKEIKQQILLVRQEAEKANEGGQK